MGLDYVENRIREALRITGGHPLKARQQIIAWTYEDSKLLHGLAKPHLTGIVAHAVSRVITKMNLPGEKEKAVKPVKKATAKKITEDQFGYDLLKALAKGDPAIFGQESYSPPVRSKQASQQHIDTMKRLAGQSSQKKK
jgi:hypothetical protein